MGIELANGLAFLHGKGVVHRDVKSANFLVDANGSVKMIDFGVSRLQQQVNLCLFVSFYIDIETGTTIAYTRWHADLDGARGAVRRRLWQ